MANKAGEIRAPPKDQQSMESAPPPGRRPDPGAEIFFAARVCEEFAFTPRKLCRFSAPGFPSLTGGEEMPARSEEQLPVSTKNNGNGKDSYLPVQTISRIRREFASALASNVFGWVGPFSPTVSEETAEDNPTDGRRTKPSRSIGGSNGRCLAAPAPPGRKGDFLCAFAL